MDDFTPAMEPGVPLNCPKCWARVERGAKFCGECGAPIPATVGPEPVRRLPSAPQQEAKPAKQKKPVHKRWWFRGLVALFILAALGAVLGEDDAGETAQTEATAEAPTQNAGNVQAVKPQREPEPDPVADNDGNSNDGNSLESCMELIRTMAAATYGEDNYTLTLDDSGAVLTFNATTEGTALIAVLAQAGNEEYIEQWDNIVASVISYTKSMQEMLKNYGHDVVIVTNILNDANRENYLLSVTLETVMFDAVHGIDLLGG